MGGFPRLDGTCAGTSSRVPAERIGSYDGRIMCLSSEARFTIPSRGSLSSTYLDSPGRCTRDALLALVNSVKTDAARSLLDPSATGSSSPGRCALAINKVLTEGVRDGVCALPCLRGSRAPPPLAM